MTNYCKGSCDQINKVPMNLVIEGKKYCTCCEYNIVTKTLRCPCCTRVYRIKRRRGNRNSPNPVGRPRAPEITPDPLFAW